MSKPILQYFRMPKKAPGHRCTAWWYAAKGSIQVYAQHADTNEICSVILTRRKLAEFIEQTKPKVKR